MKCKNCEKEIDSKTVFCPFCHTNTFDLNQNENVIKCKKCGKELSSESKFCDQCGTKIKVEKQPQGEQTYNPISPKEEILQSIRKPFYKNWLFWSICAVGVIIAIIFIAEICNSNSIPKTQPTQKVDIIQTEAVYTTEEETTAEPTTEEPTTVEPTTQKPTQKATQKPTQKPTEKEKITNNTSTGGFSASGSGDYVAEGLSVTDYGILHIVYNGTGNFSVISYEGDDYDDLLVNEIGNYSGDVLIDHSGSFDLEIHGEGNWSITSSGLKVDDRTSFSGIGDGVTGITSHSGGKWHITNSNGNSNFSVIQYGMIDGYMDLLVNEIGNYDGTVKAESGDNIFFKVTSDGNWKITKK